MDIEILEDLGLTPAEIKVYISLLELGSSKAGEIINHSGLQNSVVHTTLARLVKKGLASFIVEGKIKHYNSTDPRNVVRWIEEKKHKFEQILPELLAKQEHRERQEAEVFQGLRGLKAMCYKFIEDAQPDEDYLIFAFTTAIEQRDREIYSFYRDFTTDRMRRGLKLKGIAPVARRQLFEELEYDLGQWLFVDFPTLENVSVCGNKVIMTPWEYTPVSYLISSKQIADNFRDYFYSIWNKFH